ncbi:MAG TPA: transposase [Candidatus Omnitrophota bacterium]|nr:transposase [Candidatus Omnitrophota bacterium]
MARVARILIDYACYHLMTRGNQKEKVFFQEEDYVRYLRILGRAKSRYGALLYAYCLMPNHVHLLVELENTRNMSKFMHWVNRGYTAYFNAKYERVGHLWQGRFRSKPILKGSYLLQCSEYIESNPVRSQLSPDLASYKWSSYTERCLSYDKDIIDPPGGFAGFWSGTALISKMGTL